MISFGPFQSKHLKSLRSWLQEDHVKKFWQETEDEADLSEKFLITLPKRGIHCFIIKQDEEDIGFIQYYEAAKVGGGWWPYEKPGAFGIDLMIGRADLVGKGLGPRIIREFVEYVRGNENVRSIIIDPDPKNPAAIRAFEKAGFKREQEITTPGGAALLMRMTFAD